MSQKNHGHKRPSFYEAYLEEKMGEWVSLALRQEYEGEPSPVKKISQKTTIPPDSVKRWYTSRKPPSLGHFLMLVQNYPAILKVFLKASGHGYLTAYLRPAIGAYDERWMPASAEVFRDILNVSNVPNNPLNARQAWFLIRLQSAPSARAEDIAEHFKVAIKTARRDIEGLKMAGKIKFVGTKRTGKYQVIDK